VTSTNRFEDVPMKLSSFFFFLSDLFGAIDTLVPAPAAAPVKSESKSMELIGTGFCRTGTETLQKALNILGYNTYHGSDTNTTMALMWTEALDNGCSNVSHIEAKMLEYNFTAMVGFPSSLCWEEYLKKFPTTTLFIHTERKQDSDWLNSFTSTFHRMWEKFPLNVIKPFGSAKFKSFHKLSISIWNKMMPITPPEDELPSTAALLEAYQRHNRLVKKKIGKRRLLVIDHSEGWKPLCKFLKKPIPNVPYPRVNTKQDWMDKINRISYCLYALPFTLIGIIWFSSKLITGDTIDLNRNRINSRKKKMKDSGKKSKDD
jgi:hypothetical protein